MPENQFERDLPDPMAGVINSLRCNLDLSTKLAWLLESWEIQELTLEVKLLINNVNVFSWERTKDQEFTDKIKLADDYKKKFSKLYPQFVELVEGLWGRTLWVWENNEITVALSSDKVDVLLKHPLILNIRVSPYMCESFESI